MFTEFRDVGFDEPYDCILQFPRIPSEGQRKRRLFELAAAFP